MAVDKKSNHVGNHGGAYTDMDGMSRQFTYIDHDKKPKMAINPSKEEILEAKKSLKGYRSELITRITALPASVCPSVFIDYTIRGEGHSNVEWNIDMLIDAGVPLNQLRDLCTLSENKAEFLKINVLH